jgi:phosphopantothenoylcysteine decarboxylase/phosphopantothenate--cysteine ligase
MKVLVTAGATREPIDAVRYLSNISSGATGSAIADFLAASGHEVFLLHGEGAVRGGSSGVTCGVFGSTEQLAARLESTLGQGGFDLVVHAAAVADYRPDTTHLGKLGSYAEELVLRLVPTPKLLPLLKSWSPTPLRVLGFKLTAGADPAARAAAVGKLFAAGGVDAVVHNDMSELGSAGAGRTFRVYKAGDSAAAAHALGVPALCAWIESWARAI